MSLVYVFGNVDLGPLEHGCVELLYGAAATWVRAELKDVVARLPKCSAVSLTRVDDHKTSVALYPEPPIGTEAYNYIKFLGDDSEIDGGEMPNGLLTLRKIINRTDFRLTPDSEDAIVVATLLLSAGEPSLKNARREMRQGDLVSLQTQPGFPPNAWGRAIWDVRAELIAALDSASDKHEIIQSIYYVEACIPIMLMCEACRIHTILFPSRIASLGNARQMYAELYTTKAEVAAKIAATNALFTPIPSARPPMNKDWLRQKTVRGAGASSTHIVDAIAMALACVQSETSEIAAKVRLVAIIRFMEAAANGLRGVRHRSDLVQAFQQGVEEGKRTEFNPKHVEQIASALNEGLGYAETGEMLLERVKKLRA